MRDGCLVTLRVSLPATFPAAKPVLLLTQPLRHPLVNAEGRMSFPSLDAWTPGRSRLAAVVADATKALWGELSGSPSPQRPGEPSSWL
jgi:ubiquitin-protein ligase